MTDDQASAGTSGAVGMHSPPRLRWGWVLILSIVTFGVFWCIWLVVLSAWMRRVRGRGTAVWFATFYLVVYCCKLFLVLTHYALVPYVLVLSVADAGQALNLLGYVATISMLWYELRGRPIGLWLSGWGAYLLGPVYLQYSLGEAASAQGFGSVPSP